MGPVPLSVPLLWWLMVGGGFLVVEGLWGELRAGVSALTALITVQMALMLLPFLTSLRAYWRWPAGSAGSTQARGAFFDLPWAVLTAWLTLALGLSFGLVIVGENLSSPEARTRRQAWTPAAVLLTLTFVCLAASLLARLWLAVAFSAVNAVFFGTVVVWYLRGRGARRRQIGARRAEGERHPGAPACLFRIRDPVRPVRRRLLAAGAANAADR